MAKIVLIDADADFLESCKTLLESKDYIVSSAGNIQDGENIIKKGNPNLIVLDIMMNEPDDGIALAHKLRKDGITTPIIMLSSISKVMGYRYGKCDDVLPCNDFLEKPVKPRDLINKVEVLLSK